MLKVSNTIHIPSTLQELSTLWVQGWRGGLTGHGFAVDRNVVSDSIISEYFSCGLTTTFGDQRRSRF